MFARRVDLLTSNRHSELGAIAMESVTPVTKERPICAVCDEPLSAVWTDTHGVGACRTCGLPYRLYHYENDERVDKPPAIAVDEAWVPLAREYWTLCRRRVFPATFDMGFFGSRERTYSGASREDITEFDAWMERQKDRWPIVAGAESSEDADVQEATA